MKIAILGAGNIGIALGRKWSQAGHRVIFGVRDLGSAKTLASLKSTGVNLADTIANAIAASETVVWAVPGDAVEPLVTANAVALNSRIMIDATNRVRLADMSAVGVFTTRVPDARIFRGFNTLGWENFSDPVIGDIQADLFYCGQDDPPARRLVEGLITAVGFRPIYVGGLDQTPVLDGMTRLWFSLALGQKMGRHLAFKLLVS